MAKYVVNDTDLTAVANAIRAKTGNDGTITWPAGFTQSIAAINTSGSIPSKTRKAVNFIDYDGTIVESYEADEFLALSQLPDNPDHTHNEIPLLAQGWNWSLSDAKTFVTNYGYIDIGQNYVTTSGKTTFVVEIEENAPQNRRTFSLCVCQISSATIYVDWGDESEISTDANTSAIVFQHVYEPGRYIVEIWTENDVGLDLGDPTVGNNNAIYGSRATSNSYNRGRIREFYCGSQVTKIQDYAFHSCYNLAKMTLSNTIVSGIDQYAFYGCTLLPAMIFPSVVTSVGTSAFQNCYSITSISLPNTITGINSDAIKNCRSLTSFMIPANVTTPASSLFSNCYSITNIIIPERIEKISGSLFDSCYCLSKLTFPTTITNIAAAFPNCYSLSEVHIKKTSPPTLSSSSVFTASSIPSDLKIYVPYSSNHSILNAYKAATNWSAVADKIYEEPQ